MTIYIICFLSSIFMLNFSNKISNNKLIKFIVVLISLLIPCILAGFRASSVGTDVEVYVKNLFMAANSSNSFSEYMLKKWWFLWKFVYVKDFEIGFSFLVFIVTKFTNNFQCVLFFIETLIIFPIYFGLKKFKFLKNKIGLCFLVFYTIFYNPTLNLMRQFIGVSFVFYGSSCLINDSKYKNLKFFLSLFIAILFHESSILGIIIFLVYKLLNAQYKSKKCIKIANHYFNINKFFTISIIAFSLIIILNSSWLINVLDILNLSKYTSYISGEVAFMGSKILKITPIIIIFLIVAKSFLVSNHDSWFYILMFLFDSLILSQFASINANSGRLGYVFQIFCIVSFPLLCSCSRKKNVNKITTILLIIYLIFYWVYFFAISGSTETIPYIPYWK